MAKKKDELRQKEGVSVGIIIFGASIAMAAVLALIGVLDIKEIINAPMEWLDYAILAVIVTLGPYGFYAAKKASEIKKIESHLPDFLRDVAEAGRFGMTLADAIVVASTGRYGKLTPEIRKMAAQIEWGVPATEALRLFATRIDTTLVNRMMAIVIKASDAGGNVADVLSMVSHDAKEQQLSERERAISMTTYIAVIYIAFIVFLVTIIIMNSTFLPQMKEAGAGMSDLGGSGGGSNMIATENIDKIAFVFVLAAVFHAIGDGFVAGILDNGKLVYGMRHSFIMIIIAFLLLRVM